MVDPCVKCHIGAAAAERLSLSLLSLILSPFPSLEQGLQRMDESKEREADSQLWQPFTMV